MAHMRANTGCGDVCIAFHVRRRRAVIGPAMTAIALHRGLHRSIQVQAAVAELTEVVDNVTVTQEALLVLRVRQRRRQPVAATASVCRIFGRLPLRHVVGSVLVVAVRRAARRIHPVVNRFLIFLSCQRTKLDVRALHIVKMTL
jgi:hypothetical protein